MTRPICLVGELETAERPVVNMSADGPLPLTDHEEIRAEVARAAGDPNRSYHNRAQAPSSGLDTETSSSYPSEQLPSGVRGLINIETTGSVVAADRFVANRRADIERSYASSALGNSNNGTRSNDLFGQIKGLFSSISRGLSGFATGLGESLGLFAMAEGGWHALKIGPRFAFDVARIASGRGTMSELGGNLSKGMSKIGGGLLGMVTCGVELVGFADLWRAGQSLYTAAKAFSVGDTRTAWSSLAMAGMHATFAALSIPAMIATISTGGAAGGAVVALALGRQSLSQAAETVTKVAVKEFFEKGAREIGEAAVQGMSREAIGLVERQMGSEVLGQLRVEATKRLGAAATGDAVEHAVAELAFKQVLSQEGRLIAIEGGEALARRLSVCGHDILNPKAVQMTLREVTQGRMPQLLRELKLDEAVSDLASRLLLDVSRGNLDDLAKDFAGRFGLQKSEAEKLVQSAQQALHKGANHAEIKAVLEDGITKHVTKVLHEGVNAEFRVTFRKALQGEIAEGWSHQLQAGIREAAEHRAKIGGGSVDDLVKQLTDDLVEAGSHGVREGIEVSTRMVVSEALSDAFRRFNEDEQQKTRRRRNNSQQRKPDEARKDDKLHKKGEISRREAGRKETLSTTDNERDGNQTRQVKLSDGSIETINEVWDSEGERWIQVGSTVARNISADLISDEKVGHSIEVRSEASGEVSTNAGVGDKSLAI